MQVFRTYFKLLKSQLVSIIMYAIVFLTITIAISIAIIGSDEGDFRIKEAPIAVVNRDGENAFIEGLFEYLDQYVQYVDIEDKEEARKDALFFRKVLYIMIIPEGFTEDFLAGKEVAIQKETVPD
ncbi:MAG: ABC transporter permease, partial [Clostridiales bacterium]|nr:ABC transporter permease [Clostridiales bacterium]